MSLVCIPPNLYKHISGDFTYEDEFWANKSESTAWPVPPQLQQADILGPQVLQLLKVPLLLMHGNPIALT